ncbi:hypothetical protein HYALB_00007058 [Hymenoscyphus albidus]|uniref:Uncharacterized protein n=1 Tax=Hymenoscyphus albidus TaxID=595503 RepID=A0A9N9Q5I9_9HELO|nr:hypothetical protein HYALB_00007058 [Hymenoscyphus albidus]
MQYTLLGIAIASLWQTGYAAQDSNGNYILKPITLDKKSVYTPEKMTILKPILPGTNGLQKRQGSQIGLVNDTSLIWGGGVEDSDVMVNMTLATGDQELILSMEHFADDLVSVVCDDDLSLTFKNAEHYEEAKDDWEWVNFDAHRTFLMLVNWGNCSSEAGRQPWVVTQTEYDPANFKVKFIADQKDWSELENQFTLEWGAYKANSNASDSTPMSSRALKEDLDKFGKNLEHQLTKPEINPIFAVPFHFNLPSTFASQQVVEGVDITLGCENCYIGGKLLIGGKLAGSLTGKIGITESFIQVSPQGMVVEFNPSLSVSSTLAEPQQQSWELFTSAPPGAMIPKIFNIGPRTVIRAGFEVSSIEGGATISTGMSATFSDHALAKMDFHGNDSRSQGWQPTIDFKKHNVSAQIRGNVEIFHEIGFEFGLNIMGKYDLGFGMELRVPKLTTTLGAEFKSRGYVCDKQPEMFGVKLNSTLGTSINVAGWTGDRDNPIFSKPIIDKPLLKLADKCMVFKQGPKVPIPLKDYTSGAELNSTISTARPTLGATQTTVQSDFVATTSTTRSPSVATQTIAQSGFPASTGSTALPTTFNPRNRRHLLKQSRIPSI